jgi:hypothetical protein
VHHVQGLLKLSDLPAAGCGLRIHSDPSFTMRSISKIAIVGSMVARTDVCEVILLCFRSSDWQRAMGFCSEILRRTFCSFYRKTSWPVRQSESLEESSRSSRVTAKCLLAHAALPLVISSGPVS